MSEVGRPGIAVAGRAAAGIRLAAGCKHCAFGHKRPLGSDDAETAGVRSKRLHRLVACHRTAAATEDRHQRGQHVAGAIADGKHLARQLHLRFHAFGLDQIDQALRAERGEGRVEEGSLFSEGLDDATGVRSVRKIAPRSARHEDFGPRPPLLFQQQRAAAPLGRAAGGQQSGRAGADHDDIPVVH